MPTRSACLLLALLAFLPLPAAARITPLTVNGIAYLGDLKLAFDAGRWAVDGAGDRYDITCKAYDCFGIAVAITIADAVTDPCTGDAVFVDPLGYTYREPIMEERLINGLSFRIAEHDIGCRNLAGGPLRACTTHAGRSYTFDAPGRHCRTHFTAGEQVLHLLGGLSPR
jgi:hypothetical protein